MLIWKKYLFKKISVFFCFFLFSMFFIYTALDLSVHGVRFLPQSSFKEISVHYLLSFSSLFDLFSSLAFLFSAMKIFYELNTQGELTALEMGALSKRKFLFPFFMFAAILAALNYVNLEWIAPCTQEEVSNFKIKHKLKQGHPKLYSCSMEDGSHLVYQSYSPSKKELFDVYWIRSIHDIWHIKRLDLIQNRGYEVDHLIKKNEILEKNKTFDEKIFSEMMLDAKALSTKMTAFEARAISTLLLQSISSKTERKTILSHLFYKLLTPLMPAIILMAIAPFFLHHSRNSPIFLKAAVSILGFVSLKIILDGMLILGENHVLPSFVAIFSPVLFIFTFSFPRFLRLQ